MLSGEYSNLTKMLGGKVIKIEQGKPAGINPFELEADYKGKEKSSGKNPAPKDFQLLNL